ncbi:INO80 complex subunit 4, partial [Neolecta irregularis DAH-3]
RQQAITAAAQALGGPPASTNGSTANGDAPPPGYVHNPKLGPKANLGAINAGLRALDRSGKPCRKWHRTSFTVKTITGREWSVPGWSGSIISSSLGGAANGLCGEKS